MATNLHRKRNLPSITTKSVPNTLPRWVSLCVSGRDFTRADDENAQLVAIVNQAMAARYWRTIGIPSIGAFKLRAAGCESSV